MIHLKLSPETAFYLRAVLLAAITVVAAVKWDRWYIRRMLTKEFVHQLWLEQEGHQPVAMKRRQK